MSPGWPDVTLTDVQREFPEWNPWRGPSGYYHAGRPDTAHVTGATPLDLRDQIVGWIWRHQDQVLPQPPRSSPAPSPYAPPRITPG